MKRYLPIIALLWAALGAGCVKDPETLAPGQGTEGQISLYITPSTRTQVTTRSATPADETIDPQSVCVLLFSGNENNSTLLGWSFAVSAGQGAYGVKLPEQSGACYACVVVNFRTGIETAAAGWTKGATTLADVRQSLVTEPLPTVSGIITGMPATHPMTGGYDIPGGIKKTTTIGSSASPVILTPATVKITVRNQVVTSGPYSFVLQGATLFNAPDRGYVMPAATAQDINLLPYGPGGDASQMTVATQTVEGVTSTLPLYCYESAADNATSVIIKALYNGNEGYYRLCIFQADKRTLRSLDRSYHYKIVVRTVQAAGYRTAAEAMANPAANGIAYDIEASDPDSFDIITNGIQYLGVSNSEYRMYNSNYINVYERIYNDPIMDRKDNVLAMTPFTVTILTYTTAQNWEAGTVTASAGIHLYNDDNTAISESLTLPLPAAAGTPVRKELKACFDDDFTEGQLDIRIGDLHKVIKVTRAASIDLTGEQIPLGKDIAYVSVGVVPTYNSTTTKPVSDPSAFNLAYSKEGPEIETGNCTLVVDPGKELYLRFKNRLLEGGDYCHGTLYAHRNSSEGRVKVDFTADNRGNDIEGDYPYGPAITIAGAFWKNSERGERLIQMPQFSREIVSYSGRWAAKVVAGKEFIRLGAWDPTLKFSDSEECYPGDPEERPVEDGGTVIYGSDPIIRFRIGLTSANTGAPRYGLVHLIYMDGRQSNNLYDVMKLGCYIFVRQGEQADYILTPGKTYTDVKGNTFVAPDVKFSPYALIDPKLGQGGPDLADYTALTEDVRPVFAPYPSYSDYLFQWSGDRAFSPKPYKIIKNPDSSYPTEEEVAITGWNPDYAPAEYKELCPEGYITPPAQIGGIDIQQALQCAGPFGSNYWGYGVYMDGYFDRRLEIDGIPMTVGNIQNPGGFLTIRQHAPHAMIYKPSNDRYDGRTGGYTIFDPETFHSIFIPYTFPRVGNLGPDYNSMLCQDRRSPGCSATFWTSTPAEADPENYAIMTCLGTFNTGDSATTVGFSKSWAAPVRCIKDPNKP